MCSICHQSAIIVSSYMDIYLYIYIDRFRKSYLLCFNFNFQYFLYTKNIIFKKSAAKENL